MCDILQQQTKTGTRTGRGKMNVAFIALDLENLGGEHVDDNFHLELGDYKYPHFKCNSKASDFYQEDEVDAVPSRSMLTPQVLETLRRHLPASVLEYLTS